MEALLQARQASCDPAPSNRNAHISGASIPRFRRRGGWSPFEAGRGLRCRTITSRAGRRGAVPRRTPLSAAGKRLAGRGRRCRSTRSRSRHWSNWARSPRNSASASLRPISSPTTTPDAGVRGVQHHRPDAGRAATRHRFSPDSPLERTRFELLVPVKRDRVCQDHPDRPPLLLCENQRHAREGERVPIPPPPPAGLRRYPSPPRWVRTVGQPRLCRPK